MAEWFPLLELFISLRRRNLMLGLSEYLALLKALTSAEITSRQQLAWVCQALWATNLDERRVVEAELERYLPRELTAEDLEALTREVQRHVDQDYSPTTTDRARSPNEAIHPGVPESESDASRAATHVEFSPLESLDATEQRVTSPQGVARGTVGSFDLAGDLPVARRYMKRAWRYVRRMQRSGPRVELDMDGTIGQLQRQGVLSGPALIPRRRNHVRVVLLVDEGGSMLPFRALTRELIESGHYSGFARFDVYYFHDTPDDFVFRDRAMLDPVRIGDLVRTLAQAGIVIVSDAGAARAGHNGTRAQRTRLAIDALRGATRRIGWLNPVPRDRWGGTTAVEIRRTCGVPMFPVDRAGLDATMNLLRGRHD